MGNKRCTTAMSYTQAMGNKRYAGGASAAIYWNHSSGLCLAEVFRYAFEKEGILNTLRLRTTSYRKSWGTFREARVTNISSNVFGEILWRTRLESDRQSQWSVRCQLLPCYYIMFTLHMYATVDWLSMIRASMSTAMSIPHSLLIVTTVITRIAVTSLVSMIINFDIYHHAQPIFRMP